MKPTIDCPLDLAEGVDYEFVERPGAELYSIRLLSGEWSGIIVTYGSVSLKEEGGNLRLRFQYKIESVPEFCTPLEVLRIEPQFLFLLGELLRTLLEAPDSKIGKVLQNATE